MGQYFELEKTAVSARIMSGGLRKLLKRKKGLEQAGMATSRYNRATALTDVEKLIATNKSVNFFGAKLLKKKKLRMA